MYKIEKGQKLPILCWAEELEDEALEQAVNLANHPCVVGHVALAPDCHSGFGIPIGGIIAVENAVIPNAVGVDIGCSMSASKTNIRVEDVNEELLRKIVGGSREYKGGIKSKVPVGMSHHKKAQEHELFSDARWDNTEICKQEFESAMKQIGTMGGGNHFIELQAGADGYLWYMIHSGSRNLGYKVGNHYNKIAETLCNRWKHEDLVKQGLAFLPKGDEAYNNYLNEMNLCLDFAKASHDLMCARVEETIQEFIPSVEFESHIYTRHNYATMEQHFGRNLLVHRKGAIMAREGVIAIIPGSQGTSSYIVEGLGNPASLCSASHGSGRKMSRRKAVELLSLEKEQELMNGIIHDMTSKCKLDEAPSAYKDIDRVIELEADLVRPLVKLRPLAVVKG